MTNQKKYDIMFWLVKRRFCMRRVFKPQNALDFFAEIGFDHIELLSESNGVLDYELERNGKKYSAYASNYSMSAYNNEGVLHNFSKFWQDFLCEKVEGYPDLLVKYMERRIDNAEFLHKRKKQLDVDVDEKAYNQQMNDYYDRLEEIKSKYFNELKK